MTVITGSSVNETLEGSAQNDTIDGGFGDDTIRGGAGNDWLVGKSGRASLSTGGEPIPIVKNSGADVYLFGAGFGQDTISEDEDIADPDKAGAYLSAPSVDVIRLDAAFTPDAVSLEYVDDYHLRLRVKDTTDSILFNVGVFSPAVPRSGWGPSPSDNPEGLPYAGAGVEFIEFADGTRWDTVEAMRRLASRLVQGDDGNNVLSGGVANDTLLGGVGDDTLTGWRGRDVLDGGAGNDLIDALSIGTSGGLRDSGVDTIRFNAGGGRDTILADDTDTIQLGAGLGREGLRVSALRGEGVDNPRLSSIDGPGANLDRFVTLSFNASDSLTVKLFKAPSGQFVLPDIRLADGSSLTLDQLRQIAQAQQPLQGSDSADMIIGWAGGSNRLEGRGGDDSIYGGAGSQDVITGGKGNDLIDVYDVWPNTSAVSDTVVFNLGDGQDTVRVDGNDVISLGAGLTRSGLSVTPSKDDFDQVTLSWGNDRITLDRALMWENGDPLVTLKFADGTQMSGAQVAALMTRTVVKGSAKADYLEGDRLVPVNVSGLGGNDQLIGSLWNDSIDGGAGNDALQGLHGDDTLLGQAGDDYLVGGRGSDRLDGGAGNDTFIPDEVAAYGIFGGDDTMIGGSGADRYDYSNSGGKVLGSRGNDVIKDQDINIFSQDWLDFQGNYDTDHLWFSRSGADLKITLLGDQQGGTVTVQQWFTNSTYRIEKITASASDGSTKALTAAKVANLVNAMAAFAPPAPGAASIDAATQAKLAPVLASNWK